MALFAIVPLFQVIFAGPCGSGFTLYEKKMKREMYQSLEMPVIYYGVLLFNLLLVLFARELWTNVIGLATAASMLFFLYRIAPNIYAWHYLMSIVHSTIDAAGTWHCHDKIVDNVEAGLRRKAASVKWSDSLAKETPSSAVFEHAEWLARQIEYWKGERRSLFAER